MIKFIYNIHIYKHLKTQRRIFVPGDYRAAGISSLVHAFTHIFRTKDMSLFFLFLCCHLCLLLLLHPSQVFDEVSRQSLASDDQSEDDEILAKPAPQWDILSEVEV